MNALELAGSLEKYLGGWSYAFIFESATMLRHQQAEIKTLRIHGYKTQYELLRLEFLQQQAEIEALKAMVARLTIEGGKEIGKAQEK
jgi:hypothetical protein